MKGYSGVVLWDRTATAAAPTAATHDGVARVLALGVGLLLVAVHSSGCGDATLAVTDGYPTDDELEALAQGDGDTAASNQGGETAGEGGLTSGQPGMPGTSNGHVGEPVAIQVEMPQPGALVGSETVTVTGSATALDQITVNGLLVSVNEGRFEASIGLTAEGPQSITVQGAETMVTVPIVVDWTPPTITLNTPARGLFLHADSTQTIAVEGQAVDALSRVRELWVNGQPVPVEPDGSFTTELTPEVGLNTVEVIAADDAGHRHETFRSAIYGTYAPWGQPIADTVFGSMQASALDVLEQSLNATLSMGLVDDVVDQNAPGDGDDFRIRYVRYGRLEIELTPQQGYFDTVIRLYDLDIGVEVVQRILFFDVTTDGQITANPAELRTKLYLTLTPQGGLDAQLRDNAVALRNFDLDLDGLLDLFGELFEGLVREFTEDALLDVLDQTVLGELVAPDGLNQTIDLFGQEAELLMGLTAFQIQPTGLVFATNSNILSQADPSVPQGPGVLTTPSIPPALSGPQSHNMRLSIADDLINTFLFHAWRAGGLNLDVGDTVGDGGELDLNAETFALIAGEALFEYATPDTPVGIQIRSLLPPVATLQPPEQGILRIATADMLMRFTLEPEGEAPVVWAELAVNLELDIRLTTDEAGELDLSFAVISRAELIDEPLFDIDNNTLETLVEGLMAALPELAAASSDGQEGGGDPLGDLLGGDSEGLEGIETRNLQFVPDGPSQDFMSILLDLAVAP